MFNTGSAAMTAVAEKGVAASAICAPTGNARGRAFVPFALGFAFPPRRTGANASAADHP